MSSINFMEKLLDGVAVEWKALGELCSIGVGQAPAGNEIGEYAFVNAGTTPSGYVSAYNTEPNTITTPSRGQGGIGYVGYQTTRFWCGPLCYRIRSTSEMLSTRFLYHVMANSMKDIVGLANMAGVPALNKKELVGFPVPIPCPENPEKSLAIQAEIVRILDTFTELTTELTAELTARKKQYNYYRDQLLRFEEGEVEWKALGEVGEFTYGYAAKAQDYGDARFVRITDINVNGKLIATDSKYVDISKESERFILKKNDLLMARTGATYGKTVIFEEDYPAIYAGFLIKLSFDEKIINPKFYWHFAQSNFFWNQANSLVSGGGQPQFNANALKEVKMPIPQLANQERIVAILDKFDALTNSITEGLPREIELRQKQYEYYRNLLLTFPKDEGTTDERR